MEYRNLGNSGLKVSVVGLGCNNFGGRTDAAGTAAVVNKCIDMGITFFDTADLYSRGRSEEFMAPVLKPHRRNIVLATKSGGPMGEGPYMRGASRKYLMDALDDCLRRLETDYVDLYQLHMPDATTPIEETLRTMDDMVHSGKVRYIGCCNFSGWQIADAMWIAKSEHLTPLISAQNQYSLLERGIEGEVAPACMRFGLGVLPYFPLASGFLTGKYKQDAPMPEGARLSAPNNPFAARILNDANYARLTALEEFATARGHTMVELAISWLACQPYVGSVISGATRPEQVEENAKSADWKLTDEDMKLIDEVLGHSRSDAGGRRV